MARYCLSAALPDLSPVTLLVKNPKQTRLAPRGCLVRVISGADSHSPRERWFAVGIYSQKMAEDAVCNLPEVETSDIVYARRRLKPAEIEALALQRRQVMQCSLGDELKLCCLNLPIATKYYA
jgi:hypothetical protein